MGVGFDFGFGLWNSVFLFDLVKIMFGFMFKKYLLFGVCVFKEKLLFIFVVICYIFNLNLWCLYIFNYVWECFNDLKFC